MKTNDNRIVLIVTIGGRVPTALTKLVSALLRKEKSGYNLNL